MDWKTIDNTSSSRSYFLLAVRFRFPTAYYVTYAESTKLLTSPQCGCSHYRKAATSGYTTRPQLARQGSWCRIHYAGFANGTIPVLEYDLEVRLTTFPRNLFHINDVVPRAHDTRWNTICATFSRIKDGETGLFNIHLPYVSLGSKYDSERVENVIDAAFEKQPVS